MIEHRKKILELEKQKNFSTDENSNHQTDDLVNRKPKIFVDQLLKNQGFNESDLKDHVFTTVSAVSF